MIKYFDKLPTKVIVCSKRGYNADYQVIKDRFDNYIINYKIIDFGSAVKFRYLKKDSRLFKKLVKLFNSQ